jgi:hypothetical protein
MKNLLITAALLTLTHNACHALELYNYKDTSSKIVKLSAEQVNSLWSSAQPACIKDGAKLLGVNKSFKDARLGYRDCSSSDKAKEKQKMLGYTVNVISFTSLPADIAKKVIGSK